MTNVGQTWHPRPPRRAWPIVAVRYGGYEHPTAGCFSLATPLAPEAASSPTHLREGRGWRQACPHGEGMPAQRSSLITLMAFAQIRAEMCRIDRRAVPLRGACTAARPVALRLQRRRSQKYLALILLAPFYTKQKCKSNLARCGHESLAVGQILREDGHSRTRLHPSTRAGLRGAHRQETAGPEEGSPPWAARPGAAGNSRGRVRAGSVFGVPSRGVPDRHVCSHSELVVGWSNGEIKVRSPLPAAMWRRCSTSSRSCAGSACGKRRQGTMSHAMHAGNNFDADELAKARRDDLRVLLKPPWNSYVRLHACRYEGCRACARVNSGRS